MDELRKRIILLEETLLSQQRLAHTQREVLELYEQTNLMQMVEITSLKRSIERLTDELRQVHAIKN